MITAKVFLASKADFSGGDGQKLLTFSPDYNDGRNKEWAKYTPGLSLQMSVLDSVAEKFEAQGKYTLTFTPSVD